MALANSNKPTVISFVIRDFFGREITREFPVPTSVWDPTTGLIADLKTIRDNLVTAYNAVTNGLIFRAFITLAQTDGAATLGPSTSDLTDQASVVCNLSTVGKYATIKIPSPVDGLFQGTSGPDLNKVDPLDADLLTFLEFMTLTDGDVTVSDGEFLADTNIVKTGRRITAKVKAPLA